MSEKKNKNGAVNSGNRLDLKNFTPYLLNNLSQRVSRDLAKGYQEKYGITIAEWRVMASVANMGKATAKMVVSDSFMDKVKTSRAIKLLRQKSYIKEKTDAGDNRRIWIRLSAKGERLYHDIVPHVVSWEEQFLTSLTKAECKSLKVILSKLGQQLDL